MKWKEHTVMLPNTYKKSGALQNNKNVFQQSYSTNYRLFAPLCDNYDK